MTDHDALKSCLNCSHPLKDTDHFCPKCGQKKQARRLNLGDLLREAAVAFLGYDDRLRRTIKGLFKPGLLPELYRAGRRRSIVHPVRLFFFNFLVLLAVAKCTSNSLIQERVIKSSGTEQELVEENTEALADSVRTDTSLVDQIKANRQSDSITLVDLFSKDTATSIRLEKNHALTDDLDEIMDGIATKGLLHKLTLRQQLKLYRSQQSFKDFLLQTLVWAFLFLQPAVAFFLLVVMWRRTFFSDHLIWTVFTHASLFVFMSIYFLIDALFQAGGMDQSTNLTLVLVAICIWFVYVGIKKYYGMGGWKRILLLIYLLIVYEVSLLLIFIANLSLSFLLF